VLPLSSFSDHDRVLFLTAPEDGFLRALAARLTSGLLVVLGSDDEIREGRRKYASLDNVMFVAASAEEIPWQDGFFTQVLDPAGSWGNSSKAAMEIARVLALG
jgi:hypothetical protein